MLDDDPTTDTGPAPTPEFTVIGIIAALSIVALIFISKKMKNKKKARLKLGYRFLFAMFVLLLIGSVAIIMWKNSIDTYTVKEVTDSGKVEERDVRVEMPSIDIGVITDSGETAGTVPLESNKEFKIE